MSSRKKAQPQKEDEFEGMDVEEVDLPPTEEQIEVEENISLFQSKFSGQDYKVRAERWNENDTEWEQVERFKLDGFDPFTSLRKFGPGRYRLTLFDGHNCYVKGKRQEIRIAKIEEPDKPAAPVSPLQDPIVQLLLQNAQAEKATMMELVKSIMISKSTESAREQGAIPQLIEGLAKLKALAPVPESGTKSLEDTLKLIGLARELMPEKEDSGKSEGGMLSEVLEAVKVFKEMQGMRGRQPMPGPRPQAPAPKMLGGTQVVQNPPNIQAEEPTEDNPVKRAVKKYVPLLVDMALRQEPQDSAATFVLDRLEYEIVPLIVAAYKPMPVSHDQVMSALIEKAQDEEEVSKVFAFAPELEPHKEWIKGVIGEAVKTLLAEPEGDSESATEAAPQVEEAATA